MKITDVRPNAMEIYKSGNKKNRAPSGERSAQEDRAEISSRGRELQKYRDILKTMPDIRTERVEQLKNSIAEGSYQPAAEKIAEKIINAQHLDTWR